MRQCAMREEPFQLSEKCSRQRSKILGAAAHPPNSLINRPILAPKRKRPCVFITIATPT